MRARPVLLALFALTLVAACGSNKLQQSYDACKTDLATAQGKVTTCQSTASDCTANLATCQTNEGACSSALTTCQTNVEGCGADLTTAKGDLSNCQGSLSTAQAAVAALTASDADLTSAITAQGVSFANETGFGATTTYTFAADGSYVAAIAQLACQQGQGGGIVLGTPTNAPGTWTVSGNVVTLTDTASSATATLTAVKASDGTVDLVDFAAKQLYVHN